MHLSSLPPALLAVLAVAMLVAVGCTTTPPTNATSTPTLAGTGITVATDVTTPIMTGNETQNETVAPTTSATGTPTVAPATLTNTPWQWHALQAGANQTVIDDPAPYTVVFRPNGTYAIRADCNTGTGTFTVNGSALNLAPGAITLAYCGEESKDQLFLASLMRATAYEIDDSGKLLLTLDEPGTTLLFAAEKSAPAVSAPFVNMTWRWLGRSGSETVQVPDPERYTLTFNATGTYDLRADCNTGGGTFTVDGAKLNISLPRLTRMYCGDDSLDNQFVPALELVTGYEMSAQDRLVLYLANPTERLSFGKVE